MLALTLTLTPALHQTLTHKASPYPNTNQTPSAEHQTLPLSPTGPRSLSSCPWQSPLLPRPTRRNFIFRLWTLFLPHPFLGRLGSAAQFFYTWHCSSSHPTAPKKSPEPLVRDWICLPRAWGSGLAFLLHKPKQGFSQHYSHLHSGFAYLQAQPPVICSNESMGRLCQ